MTTNYRDTFITASPDSKAELGSIPAKAGSIAQLQHELLSARPYELTSDDLLFEVHAIRNAIAAGERDAARAAFFAKPQACLRASPLVKQYAGACIMMARGGLPPMLWKALIIATSRRART